MLAMIIKQSTIRIKGFAFMKKTKPLYFFAEHMIASVALARFISPVSSL